VRATNRSTIFFSDTAIDHPLSRGLLDDLAKLLPPPLDGTVEKLLGLPGDKPPKARADPSSLAVGRVAQQAAPLTHKLVHARMVTRAEDGDPDEHPSSPSPAAPGDGPKPPAAPAGAPQLPSDLPVEPPALVPEPPKPPVGRRDQGGVSGVPMIGHMLSPNIPRNPPNTPVPRQLLSPDGLSLPVNFPGQ
jgi:hypothetical protein